MSLVPYRSRGLDPFDLFQREMDRMMQRYLGDFYGESQQGGQRGVQGWTPQMDVTENDKDLVIKADLPGVNPNDVEITVEDGALTLRGHKEQEQEHNENNVHRVERFVGRFYRQIPLPRGTNPDDIQATANHGVLTITVPKKAEQQPRRIQVQGGAAGGPAAGGKDQNPQNAGNGAKEAKQPKTEAARKL